jgi:hypothetical protein
MNVDGESEDIKRTVEYAMNNMCTELEKSMKHDVILWSFLEFRVEGEIE